MYIRVVAGRTLVGGMYGTVMCKNTGVRVWARRRGAASRASIMRGPSVFAVSCLLFTHLMKTFKYEYTIIAIPTAFFNSLLVR